jgi:hypothetical protein
MLRMNEFSLVVRLSNKLTPIIKIERKDYEEDNYISSIIIHFRFNES